MNNCQQGLNQKSLLAWKTAGMSLSTRGKGSGVGSLTLDIKWTSFHLHTCTLAHSPPHTLQSSVQRRISMRRAVRAGIGWRITIKRSCPAVPASVWDDVSEPSCWRYSQATEAHALAVCWQTQVMFWTRPWINIAFRCCCENSHLLQPRQCCNQALTLALEGLSLKAVVLRLSLSCLPLEKEKFSCPSPHWQYWRNRLFSTLLKYTTFFSPVLVNSVMRKTFNVHFAFLLVIYVVQ